jgi:signal transduction histidine kinase
LSIIRKTVQATNWAIARDPQGRLIVPDLELSGIDLAAGADDAFRSELIKKLEQELLDYEHTSMPASQRRFLMRHLQLLTGTKFDTFGAEMLASEFVENTAALNTSDPSVMRSAPARQNASLESGSTQTIWQFVSPHRRVLLLHRAGEVETRLGSFAAPQLLSSDARLAVIPPGTGAREALISSSAGDALPGWRLALSPKDKRPFDSAADQRIAAYLWIGVLVFASVLILAALVFGLVRRQVALTQLRNDLVANVTHELKTPLSSMRLLVDTLLNSSKVDEKTTREYLQLIATENVRLSRLIDNFLTFSRIERNKYAFKFQALPPSKIIEDAVASVRERFDVAGCTLKVQTPGALPSVTADGDAMVTALINLLDNAFKYSGDDKHICLGATAENGSVKFSVTDNGIGLSARDTKRIFKRFYQVDQRLSRSGSGCGLGLSIVKFIVSAHHGSIDVESEPGKGSVFTLSIPASNPAGHT